MNGNIFTIGGFNHSDNVGEPPSTLSSCEKFSDGKWKKCASLIVARAYLGSCTVGGEFIYVFGGLNGYDTTNTIEQYNSMMDKWVL